MTRSDSLSNGAGAEQPEPTGLNTPIERRRFVGLLLAGPTVAAAAWLTRGASTAPPAAAAPVQGEVTPSASTEASDFYDLEDFLTDCAYPTTGLVKVEVNQDGTVSYALPRTEVGQGITTAIAMLIAEEMDLPLEKVKVPLSDARPELMFNMFTGGSNSINSLYWPVRTAAAVAKGQLMEAAAAQLGVAVDQLTSRLGAIQGPNGTRLSYGELAVKAASLKTTPKAVELKAESAFTLVGKPTRRIDALDIVTGRKQFTTDLQVPDAKPCMVCRPPTINGKVGTVHNLEAVRAMPGITDVVPIASGVAVRGETFGQCIDAVNALQVDWKPGTKDAESDETVLRGLKAAAKEMQLQPGPGQEVVEAAFTFAFASSSALEPNSAIADVKSDRAEIWSTLKIPIAAQEAIAELLGLPIEKVTVHVISGGGSFGRRLFADGALDAAEASQKMGKPVKLMWHRADEPRHGRVHPMAYSKVRAIVSPQSVLGYEQQLVSVHNDLSHGLGDIFTADNTPSTSGEGTSKFVFDTTQRSPYNFGQTRQYLNETHAAIEDQQPHSGFNTGSMRSVYSQQVRTAQELFVDMLADKFGMDRLEFRKKFAKLDKTRTVLDKVGEAWKTDLPPGVAQGVAVHLEHKQAMACLVELDCRPETVNRQVRKAVTGPRVTRAVFATIPGKVVVNPLGMEAQIQGGFLDGVAYALTAGLHLVDGHFLEASWDNYAYTRQWNVPVNKIEVHILPPDPMEKPAGQGEGAVSLSRAATACAYVRATGQMPSIWPVAHQKPLHFEPYPTVPPLPLS